METWMSWAVFLAIAGAAYWYYNQKNNTVARGRSTTRAPTTSSLKDAVNWADAEVKSKGPVKAAKAKAPRKSVKTAVQEVGNKAEAYLSAASTTGADADDDLSPVTSPTIATNKAPSGRDVSDMLGSQAAVPSVLSIKPAEKPGRAPKPQTQKVEAPQESKKQRQNRKKVEEAKAAREEEEKQRQALLEKQRRTAREARGEPAKNGLQAAKAPSSNPWTTVPSRGAVQPPASAPRGQLLDTFEAPSTTSSSDAPTNGTAPTPGSLTSLSEEEQLRLVMQDSAWTTVPKGGKKQRKTVNDELLDESSGPGAVEAHAPVKPVRPTQAMTENKKPSSRYQILSEEFTPQAHDDSDWPVV
ncbi:hypothetical protein BKA66DRAFT_416088 [Pyrenochaeta sp. MPI-SDFR-AT-0127]|nr:hypothetical protein BKA66DRAFT_416088 [Pyrenochaeta sp. MPI-SDFR-AT-0127]